MYANIIFKRLTYCSVKISNSDSIYLECNSLSEELNDWHVHIIIRIYDI